MILYFSATNNSLAIALQVKAVTKDQLVSIPYCLQNKQTNFSLSKGERLGIIFPTYFLGLPANVEIFLSSLQLHAEEQPYVYLITTYGNSSGHALRDMEAILQKRGIKVQATFGVRMVDTWSPIFNISNKEKNNRKSERAIQKACDFAHLIQQKKPVRKHEILPYFFTNQFHNVYHEKRHTVHFHVEDTCTSCSLCERNCPEQAIQLQDGKPVWVKHSCLACLGCLHHCPVFAIQYGEKTKQHGQYVNPIECK